MSSYKQKTLENERYPHVKRGWLRAIKKIRDGGVFKSEYIWWNIRRDWMPLQNVGGLLRTQTTASKNRNKTPLPGFHLAHLLTA